MFDKPVEALELEDITQLIEVQKEPEGQFVDYKRELTTTNEAKKELIKDVSAFSNSQSGYLIIGIEEAEGLPIAISGTPKSMGRQKIDEWINSVLSANAEPKLSYEIKVINYETDKAVVVIHAQNSPKKPHMTTYDKRNTYYRRHLDITSPATHQEVRDMFSESQSTQDKLRNFLDGKQLIDDNFSEFGLTSGSRRLINTTDHKIDKQRPLLIVSLIPSVLVDDLVDPVQGDIRRWINTHTKGFSPIAGKDIFMTHESEIDIKGITFPNNFYDESGPSGYKSYVEFLSNGYIELGLSRQIFSDVPTSSGGRGPLLVMSSVVAIAHAMFNLGNQYYPAIGFDDEAYLQISLRNVRGFALTGFDKRPRQDSSGRQMTWASPYTLEYEHPPTLKNHLHIKIIEQFKPNGRNETTVNDLIYNVASRLSRAFGTPQVKCFDEAKTYDPTALQYFNI